MACQTGALSYVIDPRCVARIQLQPLISQLRPTAL